MTKRKAPPWLLPVAACKPRLQTPKPPLPSEPNSVGFRESSRGASSSGSLPSRPVLASRKDTPTVTSGVSRGTRPTGPLAPGDRQRLLDAYDSDVHAKTATGTAESLWKTWIFYHERWYGLGVPCLPITVESIRAVVAQLKDQQYASVANFISAAKDHHLAQRYEWDDFLSREAKRATRTGTRGKGGAKQDDELDIDQAFNLHLSDAPLVQDGPCAPTRLLEIGSFHVLREIELSTALASSVSFNDEITEESFCLPVSKTDPRALGCTRSWGCVCDGFHSTPCAYHAMKDQIYWLEETFPGIPLEELPLFPDQAGLVVDKTTVVETIEDIAMLLGEDLLDQQGRRRFGGHTLRISGARRLARLAIPTATIMLLARWSSIVVLRYIKEAPLKALTQEYRSRTGKPTYSLTDVSRGIDGKIRAAIQQNAVKYELHDRILNDLAERISAVSNRLDVPAYVRNYTSGAYHRADTTSITEYGFSDKMTPCGWKYHRHNSQMYRNLPPLTPARDICGRCLKLERSEAQVQAAVESSDNEASQLGDSAEQATPVSTYTSHLATSSGLDDSAGSMARAHGDRAASSHDSAGSTIARSIQRGRGH